MPLNLLLSLFTSPLARKVAFWATFALVVVLVVWKVLSDAEDRGAGRVVEDVKTQGQRADDAADLGQLDVTKCPAGHWDRNTSSCKNQPVWSPK